MSYWTLSRLGREYYTVAIITDPQLSAWEISFDHGVSWNAMAFDAQDNSATILVAGPDFVPGNGDTAVYTEIPASVMPYIRCTDNPEVIVRSTPRIDIV